MKKPSIPIRRVSKPISLLVKHDFLAIALADPGSRNKRRPRMTAFDGAVLTVVITHVNTERGFAFIGIRSIASKLQASPSGVAKCIAKLKRLGILIEVEGARRNRAARLTGNWAKILDPTVYGRVEDDSVHGDDEDVAVHAVAANTTSTAVAVDETVRKRTRKGANGTGRASLARAATSPQGLGGGRRSARRASKKPTTTADDLLERRRRAKTAE